MIRWARELVRLLKKAGVEVEAIYLYVDDVRIVLKAIRPGVRFCTKCKTLWWGKKQEQEDMESGESEATRTARVLREIMNSICPDLTFTTETSEDFEANTLPTLDYQMWTVDEEAEDEDVTAGEEEAQHDDQQTAVLPEPAPFLAEDPRSKKTVQDQPGLSSR